MSGGPTWSQWSSPDGATACRRRQSSRRPSREEAEAAVRTLLRWAGDDPEPRRPDRHPARVVEGLWRAVRRLRQDADALLERVFEEVEGYADIVLVRDIPFYSHCEHHMVPFIGKAHIAYYPTEGVVGLSKLARVVDIFARRLQTQETMTAADRRRDREHLKPRGVAVMVEAEHLCMSMRGVQKAGRLDDHDPVHGRVPGGSDRAGPLPDPRAQQGLSRLAPDPAPDPRRAPDGAHCPSPRPAPAPRSRKARPSRPASTATGSSPASPSTPRTGDVLMVAHMNAEALARTLETGEAWYWSRSRGELWHKGATSAARSSASSRCGSTATRTRCCSGSRRGATAAAATPAAASCFYRRRRGRPRRAEARRRGRADRRSSGRSGAGRRRPGGIRRGASEARSCAFIQQARPGSKARLTGSIEVV